MALLQAYDPPARMTDFDSIRGQRDAWHRFVLESFDGSIQTEAKALRRATGGAVLPQFYSAVRFDPGPAIEQAVVWNAFPKELLRRYGRTRALVEADRLWPMSAYDFDWRYNPDIPSRTGEGAPASLPVEGLRVEQGRNQKGALIDDTHDPKYHLTAKVEDLFDDKPAAAALASPAANRARPAASVRPPPKRTYRQGEI